MASTDDFAARVGLTAAELDEFIANRRKTSLQTGLEWGHLYELTANSIVLDHRPDYWKRVRDGLSSFKNRLSQTGTEQDDGIQQTVMSLGNLVMYILYGWETGIYNEFRHLQLTRGFSKAQLMELVMYGNLTAGIRGLQHVYNAVGRYLPDWSDGAGPLALPASWAADPDAFKAGLDLSVRELTDQDRKNVTQWYERTVGYVPGSASFAMRHHPEFYKWHRARWEIIFQTLPKQTAPYVMIRQNMIAGFRDAIREATLLGRSWNMGREWLVHAIMVTAWYTGFEGLYAAHAAVNDILQDPTW